MKRKNKQKHQHSLKGRINNVEPRTYDYMRLTIDTLIFNDIIQESPECILIRRLTLRLSCSHTGTYCLGLSSPITTVQISFEGSSLSIY